MNQSNEDSNKESIHNRFINLFHIYSKAKDDIRKLEKMVKKGQVSEETYETMITKNKEILNDSAPQLKSLRSDMRALYQKYTEERQLIDKKLDSNKKKMDESIQLYKAKIITEMVHYNKVGRLKEERRHLEADHKEKDKKILELQSALENKESLPPKFPNPLNYTTNYFQRFLTFLVLTQSLCFLLFIVNKSLNFTDLFEFRPIISLLFFGLGIVLMAILLFKSVKARASTFFSTAGAYLIISGWIVYKVGALSSLQPTNFFELWASWNLIFSVLIPTIGIVRPSTRA